MDTMEQRAEEIVTKWIEYHNSWISDAADTPLGRDYVISYNAQEMHHEHAGTITVSLYIAVDDELNNATLIGVFETLDYRGNPDTPRLVFAAAEVDTMWRDFYGDSANGLGFTNTP